MTTELGVVCVLGLWAVAWLVAVCCGYDRKQKRDWAKTLLFAFYVVRPGHLPGCDARHQGDTVIMGGATYTCDASLQQWLKETVR